MKCSENTPACGASVEAFAVEVITKSMSPERIFCSITGSWPSCAPGELVDRELAAGKLLQLGVEDVGRDAIGGRARLVVGEAELALRARRTGQRERRTQGQCGKHTASGGDRHPLPPWIFRRFELRRIVR
jgi:hypothetical protein